MGRNNKEDLLMELAKKVFGEKKFKEINDKLDYQWNSFFMIVYDIQSAFSARKMNFQHMEMFYLLFKLFNSDIKFSNSQHFFQKIKDEKHIWLSVKQNTLSKLFKDLRENDFIMSDKTKTSSRGKQGYFVPVFAEYFNKEYKLSNENIIELFNIILYHSDDGGSIFHFTKKIN
ncbi:hypothetical protein JW968_00235 [Candidatus Woesearchaeota archaeon]|nr:hypothetical protein [Candidatus Woesearchaeota archaeon]